MATTARKIGRLFSPLQIGSIADCIEPLSAGSEAGWALEMLKDREDYDVIPIERDGAVLGVLSRHVLEDLVESAWKRFWQKDLDAYIILAMRTVEATDYVDRIVAEGLHESHDNDPGWYIVQHHRSYLGIVNLRRMLEHLNEIRAQDLRRAGEIQRYLLHKAPVTNPAFSLTFFNRMAHEIGGDFYRSAQIGKDQYVVACFDVAGKNISGALATEALGAFFTALRLFSFQGDPRLTTGLINALVREVNPDDVFVTALLLYLDLDTRSIEIHNCGFSPLLAFIPQPEHRISCKLARPNLPPLGIDDNLSIESPPVMSIVKGLRLCAYSDGLTDMADPFGERYGDDRTLELLREMHKTAPGDLVAALGHETDRWIGESHLADDITVMDIRFL